MATFKEIPLYQNIKKDLIRECIEILNNDTLTKYEEIAIHIMFRLYQINAQDRLQLSRKFDLQTEERYLEMHTTHDIYEKLLKEYPEKQGCKKFTSVQEWVEQFFNEYYNKYLLKRDERVKKYTRKNDKLDNLRDVKLIEQNKKCYICNNPGYNLDHILPYKYFPELDLEPDNRVMLCYDCNVAKTDKIPLGNHKNYFISAIKKMINKNPELKEKILDKVKITGVF
jgi:5-methylcytosine-specific restriction endonuclease McrA